MIRITGCLVALLIGINAFSQSPVEKRGAILYEKHCSSCHQKDGAGVPRLIPPLVKTTYVTGEETRLIRILLEGLNEPIVVQEEEYFSPMASFSQLSDTEIAAILTFVRKQFGPNAGPVSAGEVRMQRKLKTPPK